MFFSGRIGLHDGQTVPIQGGGRLMGKAGAYNVGVLSITTDEVPSAHLPATRSSVMRIKRDILTRSSIGVLATERTPSIGGHATGYVVGADLTPALFRNVEAVSYYARSRTPGSSGDEDSYRGRFFCVLTELISVRTIYAMTPRMFVTAFLQYNSAAAAGIVGLNTRFRWEYAPGSDLFLVYSEGHDTTFAGFRGQSNRQLVVKLTRLFRF